VSDVAELAAQLVAIESINPDVVAGGSGEAAIARFVAEWCERAGLETTLSELASGRFNVVAVARGSGSDRSLMLNAHMDTVGVAGMTGPFEPRLEGGRLYGRGAQDIEGSLAACMLATAEAGRRDLRGDVILAAVAARQPPHVVRQRRPDENHVQMAGVVGEIDALAGVRLAFNPAHAGPAQQPHHARIG